MTTHVCILDSLKRRNNARSNLVCGLRIGFAQIGTKYTVVQDKEELAVEPEWIPNDCTLVIMPYWIGPKAFQVNLSDIRRTRPSAKIALYTGTSPFWDGCPWIDYRHCTRSLDPVGLNEKEKLNFESIDYWFVVHPRERVSPLNQHVVGMGVFSELTPGGKSPSPIIVLDYLKDGWDEPQYERSLKIISELCKTIPALKVTVLGSNNMAPKYLPGNRVYTLPHQYAPFEQMVRLWRTSWAFVGMNESFGYPLIENAACGTPIFCDSTCEIPTCHTVNDISALGSHLEHWTSLSKEGREMESMSLSSEFFATKPHLCDWRQTCVRILDCIGDQ